MTSSPKRCAIYTRKSTEAGLEQDFNSLDAQREACAAYIKSQTHENWVCTKVEYDDGGYSGGSMDRPALTRLFDDIEAGKIDIVVVYKVDRLTRSLLDFSKIIELLDRHNASFVSVTQQFNTTTSMGRLTLNVLLSFAQFEREVTSERIRDKIAASKKKGLWMGGPPPLGYDIDERQLKANVFEADVVRQIFTWYLELGSVRELKAKLDRLNLRTKSWITKSGREQSGAPFTRGRLYHLLKNPIYVGQVSHKQKTFTGQHDAIVPLELWTLVQNRLKEQFGVRKSKTNQSSPCWLVGLMFDHEDKRFRSTQTSKRGRTHFYYVTHVKDPKTNKDLSDWRLPAREIERVVVQGLLDALKDPVQLLSAIGVSSIDTRQIVRAEDAHGRLRDQLTASHRLRSEVLCGALKRVTVNRHCVMLEFNSIGLRNLVAWPDSESGHDTNNPAPHDIRIPVQLKRRGVESRLIFHPQGQQPTNRDDNLVRLIAKAHVWFEQLKAGERESIELIAKNEGINPGDVSRALPLAFLAPSIVRDILDGRQPADLTTEKLRRFGALPSDWTQQRRVLGFGAVENRAH